MSNYLTKLKKIENEKISDNTPALVLTKPPKGTSVSFDSGIQGVNEKNSIEIKMIQSWLLKIDEPKEDHYLVLDKCMNDPEALQYFLKHANGGFDE